MYRDEQPGYHLRLNHYCKKKKGKIKFKEPVKIQVFSYCLRGICILLPWENFLLLL